MLPGKSGFDVLREMREKGDQTPVLFLTALSDTRNIVRGLDLGASDYMVKPFELTELLARIRLVLRKRPGNRPETDSLLTCGELSLSVPRHEVRYRSEEIDLTSREFSLLQTLLENKNLVLSRDTLLEKVWGYDYMGETNVVDVYIRYLRSKIDNRFGVTLIQTVRGVGYVLKDPEHANG